LVIIVEKNSLTQGVKQIPVAKAAGTGSFMISEIENRFRV
jgi:hypothetical protein